MPSVPSCSWYTTPRRGSHGEDVLLVIARADGAYIYVFLGLGRARAIRTHVITRPSKLYFVERSPAAWPEAYKRAPPCLTRVSFLRRLSSRIELM